MRHLDIDFNQLQLPDGWHKKAQELLDSLKAAQNDKQRSEIIKKNQDHWKAVKHVLESLFNYKCWYTEAPQQGTDVDVDHFRPKKRVQETLLTAEPHDGYWWLTFSLQNYRCSCIVANRRRTDVKTGVTGGKADHFPLCDEGMRARTPDCDLEEEQPILLDPLKATDVQLLQFKPDGEAMPRFSKEKHARKFMRADQSILFYNLNHSDFVRCRIELRDQIDKEVNAAKRYFNKLETGDADNDFAYEQTICRLLEMTSKRAPFSSFCIAYLDGFKHKPEYEGVLDAVYL
ncbi:hypothetical protein ACU4M6_003819 [Raoultella ornithinolytica]|uniref:hypothetical protein n=1 Tax=Enterobacterales TaxID=91347 RepID=UPI000CF342E3|nr:MULTISPECIES: hypothetical protein [Enterobacteriaceae]MDU7884167.1 hypothetical protein [Klebsiella michiganensis]HBC8647327.1 hypothetical protein [Citrobacter koseri]HDJ1435554.1 hypothetical protein [Enterobacter asburiae]ELK6036029.1 hypothetical protein [Raoultella ornithinolytica]ELM7288318.1 hypothetical protein [Raoultella ornithinolytica]